MVDENYGFCPHCGENLKSDAVYCPACGAILKQDAAQASYYNAGLTGKAPMGGLFLFAFVLLVIYSIFELVSAATCLMFNESMYEMMDQAMMETFGMTFSEYMYEFGGIEVTKDQFLSDMFVMGISGVISAITAGISAFFCYKREGHRYAVGFCIISAIVMLVGSALAPTLAGFMSGLMSIIPGLIVAYMVFASKKYFAN